jgi:Skp family chaperone for outer membrane proteins
MTSITIFLFAAATLSTAHAQTNRDPASPAKPPAIAVVDVQEAFNLLEEKAAIEADLRDMAAALEQQKQALQTQLRQLEADLEILPDGTPVKKQKLTEYEQTAIRLRVFVSHGQAKLTRERGVRIELLYRRLLEGVAAVAEANRLDLVLFKEPQPDFRGKDPDQIAALIQVRKVLYHRDALDITRDVVNHLNGRHRGR